MALRIGKKTNAKKYQNKPEQHDHAFYAPERLLAQWSVEGQSSEQIKANLIAYLNSEREKCIADVVYFAETYGFIRGAGSTGLIPITLEPYQKDLLSSFQKDKYIITVKARQLGVSTSLVFYALWFSIFSTGKNCLVVAHRKESAEEFVTKLKTAYEFLPEWLKPACTLYSKNTVEFETKSTVKAITSNPNAARSFSATVFLVDEAAFIKDADEVIKGLLPTLSASDGKLIAISTPNGNAEENWFYKTFVNAKAGINGWKWFELPWTVNSMFTQNPHFKQDQIRIDNGNVDKFRQEFECVFDVNLSSLFKRNALNAFIPSDKILNRTFGGVTYEDTLFIWSTSTPSSRYRIGVDCASNKASARDDSCFQVIDEDTYEQCAEYLGKLPTEVFVDILIKTARHYNNALLVIESNSYSEMVFYLLEQKGYTNVWYNESGNPGFQTNRRTRGLLIEKLILFYNNPINSSKLKSHRLKVQMENFSANTVYADGSKKYEAGRGTHDDTVMALALGVVTLTPKEHIHRPLDTFDVAVDTKNLPLGEYADEYLEYHSDRMGISKAVLENRLKMYHAIKSGVYDGSGIEELELQHPVEEFERRLSSQEFIGNVAGLITDTPDMLDNISLVPTEQRFDFSDIFDDKLQLMMSLHQNFLHNTFNF